MGLRPTPVSQETMDKLTNPNSEENKNFLEGIAKDIGTPKHQYFVIEIDEGKLKSHFEVSEIEVETIERSRKKV